MTHNTNIIAKYVKNRPPVLNPIGNKAIKQYEELDFQISAVDPDGDELVYSAQGDKSDCFDPLTQNFHWRPGYGTAGTYTITFSVTDSDQTDEETITIEVEFANGAPEFDLPDRTINENVLLEFDVEAIDPEGESITYSASGELGDYFDPETRHFSWTPSTADIGPHSLTITATDEQTNARSKTCIITVKDVNYPPEFDLTDKSVAKNERLTFEVSATDQDADPLTYTANGSLAEYFDPDTHIFDWTPNNSDIGDHSLTIAVSDGVDDTVKTITIHVIDHNHPPVITLSDHSVEETETLMVQIVGRDLDNDLLTFSAANLPEGANFHYDTQIFEWTPDYGEAGNTYDVTFTVSDGEITVEDIMTISVGVRIVDSNLEAAIKDFLAEPKEIITPTDMLTIEDFDASNRNISDIRGVEYMTNLRDLTLNDNNISDLNPLINLNKLEYLELVNNNISDLQGLPHNSDGTNTNLLSLNIEGNNVHNLDLLENFSALRDITASSNQIDSVFDPSMLSNLRYLRLNDNSISDISSLAKLSTTIEQIKLSDNGITNIDPLSTIYSLTELRLTGNPISNIDSLFHSINLSTLYVNRTNISKIEVLKTLAENNLTHVDLSNNSSLDLSEGSLPSQVITYIKGLGVTVIE